MEKNVSVPLTQCIGESKYNTNKRYLAMSQYR